MEGMPRGVVRSILRFVVVFVVDKCGCGCQRFEVLFTSFVAKLERDVIYKQAELD